MVKKVILTFLATGTLFTLAWVLWYCNYGFDFTDESFYLVWISEPFNYSVSATQFGFVYHPLYQLLNGNIAALRQCNILITFCLAWALSNVFLKTVYCNHFLEDTPRIIVSSAIATSSLLFLISWLATPNYNSLTLQGLLVVTTGILLADKYASGASILGWFLVGVGGWLVFMAKPTSAAALGLCAGLYLFVAGKLNLRLLALSVATAVGAIVLSVFIIDGSIVTFIDRLKGGAEMYHTLGGGHSINHLFRLDSFQLDGSGKFNLVACTAVFFLAAYFSQAHLKVLLYSSTLLSGIFFLATLGIVFGLIHPVLPDGKFKGLLLCSIPFAVFLVRLSVCKFKCFSKLSRAQWALLVLFVVMPYVYAFGSANNYWVIATRAGIFWVLSGFIFFCPVHQNQQFSGSLLSLGFAIQMISVALVYNGIQFPYRQPQPLYYNDYKFEMGGPGSTLVLPEGFGRYLADATILAKNAGFKKGTPMIDLTGQSPGILYAMGASSIGQPWTVGGYAGSEELAEVMLKKVSCQQLATAWLLVEPEGPRKISPEVLLSFGANPTTDFEVVGTLRTAKGAGGYKKKRVQQLLKPVRLVDDALAACSAVRVPKK